MSEQNLEKVLEALLFASDKPLTMPKLKDALGVDADTIRNALEQLKQYYIAADRSIELKEIAEGYQIGTKPDYSVWISKLYKKIQDKIRGASMETLAIIVYKQPITKAEIEAIRGVDSDGVIKTLMEKSLVRIKGRKDAPGRPLLYGTTDEFLIRFGLKDLHSLPPLKEFTEKDIDFGNEENILPVEEVSAEAAAETAGETAGAPQETIAETGQDLTPETRQGAQIEDKEIKG